MILDCRDLVALHLAAAPHLPRQTGRHKRRDARDVLVARPSEQNEPLESSVPHHVRRVEHQRVKTRVQVERITETLDECHHAEVHITRVDQPDLLAHLATDPTGHRAREHAQHDTEQCRLVP